MPIANEKIESHETSFREKLSLGKVSRPRRKTKVMKHEEDPPVVSLRSLGKNSLDKRSPSQKKPFVTESKEDMEDLKFRCRGKLPLEDVAEIQNRFREKLTLGKVSGPRRKTKVMKREEDSPVVPSQSLGNISLDKLPLSQKKPFVTESKEDTEDIEFRFGVQCTETNTMKRKVDEGYDYLWSDNDMDDLEPVVTGYFDMHALAEARKRKEDPDDIYFQWEKLRIEAHNYATAALSYMHKQNR